MNFVQLVDYYSDWWEIEKLTDLISKSVVKNIIASLHDLVYLTYLLPITGNNL